MHREMHVPFIDIMPTRRVSYQWHHHHQCLHICRFHITFYIQESNPSLLNVDAAAQTKNIDNWQPSSADDVDINSGLRKVGRVSVGNEVSRSTASTW